MSSEIKELLKLLRELPEEGKERVKEIIRKEGPENEENIKQYNS